MPGFWQISNRGLSGSAATATQAFAPAATVGGQQVRLRSLEATLSGASAGTDQLVVRDGASGVGTVIFTADLSIPANGFASMQLSNLDIRATAGNNLTVEFVSGVTSDRENVNAQGDFVIIGTRQGG